MLKFMQVFLGVMVAFVMVLVWSAPEPTPAQIAAKAVRTEAQAKEAHLKWERAERVKEWDANNCDDRFIVNATLIVKSQVKLRLKQPHTAEFPALAQLATYDGECLYTIGSYVTHQNMFGASIRHEFVGLVELKRVDGVNTWNMKNLVVM